MHRVRARHVSTSVFAVLFALSAWTVTSAAIPHSVTKVYVACMNSLGSIRLIDHQAGKRCTSKERTISWNQRGPTGAAGKDGANGVSGYEIVTKDFVISLDAMTGTSVVACPEGKVVIGGGYDYGKGFDRPRGQYGPLFMDASYP